MTSILNSNTRQALIRLVPAALRAQMRLLASLNASERREYVRVFFDRIAGGNAHVPARLPADALVLFVCHGNIYRSPMAEALLRDRYGLDGSRQLRAISAGLTPSSGRAAPADARAVAREYGVSLDPHASQPLSTELVRSADVVAAMDRENSIRLLARFPEVASKLVLLGSFDPLALADDPVIADPYGRGVEAVRACYSRVDRSVRGLAEAIELSRLHLHQPESAAKKFLRKTLTARPMRALWEPRTHGNATVFMLHRFADREIGVPGHDPIALSKNLEFLRRNRYELATLESVVARFESGEPIPAKTVVFTVDDGYSDFANVGGPVFAAFDCPVSVFVVSGFIDGKRWLWWDQVEYLLEDLQSARIRLSIGGDSYSVNWDRPNEREIRVDALVQLLKTVPTTELESALLQLQEQRNRALPQSPPDRFRPLSWPEIRLLSSRITTFGAHTRTHPVLSRCEPGRSSSEIVDSWNRLREELPRPMPIFAYPHGNQDDFGSREQETVSALGLVAAMRAYGGYCTPESYAAGRYSLPRSPYDDRPSVFRQFVSGLEQGKSTVRRVFHREVG